MIYSELLKLIWRNVYDPNKDILMTINEHFHQDYEQCINGVIMQRDQYIQHVIEQRKNMTIEHIDYQHILESNNELFALYTPRGVDQHQQPVEAEVIAYFRFEKLQILRIYGQVRLLSGELSVVDMRS